MNNKIIIHDDMFDMVKMAISSRDKNKRLDGYEMLLKYYPDEFIKNADNLNGITPMEFLEEFLKRQKRLAKTLKRYLRDEFKYYKNNKSNEVAVDLLKSIAKEIKDLNP